MSCNHSSTTGTTQPDNRDFWHGVRICASGAIYIAFKTMLHLELCTHILLESEMISESERDLIMETGQKMKPVTVNDDYKCNRCGRVAIDLDWLAIERQGQVRFGLFCHDLPTKFDGFDLPTKLEN